MKARVLVTHKCHRNCDGCCNKDANLLSKIKLPVFTDLLKYSEIMITGGEPMLIGDSVSRFINELHSVNYRGKIYLYTTLVTPILFSILPRIDGIHFTLHYESDDSDVKGLKTLSHYAGFRASVISKR
jgi:MoaA/NifB/PqqE/SkfB family radical SAM enzyme